MKKPWKERPVRRDRQIPQKKIYDERGVSPVIGTILMVAITVVLAAVVYMMVIDIPPPNITPQAKMTFDETDGIYTLRLVSINRVVEYKDVSTTITDISTRHSASMDPITDGGVASCGPGELNITYQDVNSNEELDAGDVFYVYNGDENDIIVLTYTKGSGGLMCEVKLS